MTGYGADAVDAIAQLARNGIEDRPVLDLVDGRLAGVVLAEGEQLYTIDLDLLQDQPRRKTGTVSLSHPDSFVAYVNRHKEMAGTTVWADVDRARFVAVLNDHLESDDGNAAGWGDHRAVLTLPLTEDWKFWTSQDGQLVTQQAFAEHIEQGAHCLVDPDPAAMLEIAQTFQAKTGVDFKSSSRLQSGETQLRYEETTSARAGVTGSIDIPDVIKLRLQPYEGSPSFDVIGRFRYRINNGQLALGYRLIRAEQARRDALADVAAAIGTAVALDVLLGVPR